MQLMDEIRSENGANILSLFDGMACGLVAMIESGVKVNRYIAYEIDKYAVKTSQHNFPFIEHKGDVFQADFTEYRGGLDYLIGGSPCTYWSIAQNKSNRETEASGLGWELFSQYVRALHESEPKFFIYENNKSMSNAIRESITKAFGFEPICINSALVSAQNRQRLYWVGRRNDDGSYSKVKIEQPVDRGILLRDILEYGTWINPTNNSKSRTIHAGMSRLEHNMIPRINHENPAKQQHDCIVEPVCMRYQRSEEAKMVRKQYETGKLHHGFHELSELHPRNDGKTNTLSTVLKDNPICERVCIAERGGYPPSIVLNMNPSGNGINGAVSRIDTKSRCLTTNKGEGMKIILPVCVAERGRYVAGNINQHFEARDDGKTNTLTTVQKDNNIAEPVWFGNVETAFAIPSKFDGNIPVKAISASDGKEYDVYCVRNGIICVKGKEYQIKLPDGYYIIRKLTVTECRKLQTVPDWYEFPVSNTQAYKMLGNGWTCSVISHLINATLENK